MKIGDKVLILPKKDTPPYWKTFENKIGQIIRLGYKPPRFKIKFKNNEERWFGRDYVVLQGESLILKKMQAAYDSIMALCNGKHIPCKRIPNACENCGIAL